MDKKVIENYIFETIHLPIQEVRERRSVRFFKEKDTISEKNIATILEAARHAPSAKNMQPLEYIVITDQEIKDGLAEYCQQPQPKICPVSVVVVGDLELAGLVGEISTHTHTTKEKGQYMFLYMDAAAAIENMLLTATSLNIDSLWISSLEAEQIGGLLRLPLHMVPVAAVCLGHRTKPPFTPKKRDLKERLHFNEYRLKEKDMSYLEDCKMINEEHGEYKQ